MVTLSNNKLSELFSGLTCRNCNKSSLLTIIEEEYDYEISCANCGELWWIEKEREVRLVGDDLKYISSANYKKCVKKSSC